MAWNLEGDDNPYSKIEISQFAPVYGSPGWWDSNGAINWLYNHKLWDIQHRKMRKFMIVAGF